MIWIKDWRRIASQNYIMREDDPNTRWVKRNALDLIEHEHRIQAQICDTLELIADSLPDCVDKRLCAQVACALREELPLHHRDEECGLFPLIEERALPGDGIAEILARLAMEHATDESFASELLESLDILSEGRELKNPDMVGYMLRSFFESYRRHLHWENAVVLPLARSRLMPQDIVKLEEAMARNRGHEYSAD
ncbi:MAG: hemerythrin domain-containing protein [Rhizobiales bacterium]|nr:hemerythrin domain-containing protein [Hyphomicrobiales bacterium]